MKETYKLIIALTAIAVIAGLLVALVESKTRDPIKKAREKAFIRALGEVLPPSGAIPETKAFLAEDASTNFLYYASDGAIALEVTTSSGYSGDIKLIAGFTADDRLYGYKVLEHAETPGLGAQITGGFHDTLTNRPAASQWKVEKDGGDIEAIAAATISSRAVCEAIAEAAEKLSKIRAL